MQYTQNSLKTKSDLQLDTQRERREAIRSLHMGEGWLLSPQPVPILGLGLSTSAGPTASGLEGLDWLAGL